jgi:hypothetical protein
VHGDEVLADEVRPERLDDRREPVLPPELEPLGLELVEVEACEGVTSMSRR